MPTSYWQQGRVTPRLVAGMGYSEDVTGVGRALGGAEPDVTTSSNLGAQTSELWALARSDKLWDVGKQALRRRELGEAGGLALQQAFVNLAALREIGQLERADLVERERIAERHRQLLVDARVLRHADQVVLGCGVQSLATDEEREVLAVRVAVAFEVRYTDSARDDLLRLFEFLLDRAQTVEDFDAAQIAIDTFTNEN